MQELAWKLNQSDAGEAQNYRIAHYQPLIETVVRRGIEQLVSVLSLHELNGSFWQ